MSTTVIMTCFNEGPYIGAAVRSVLAQTAASEIDKIIIMDDGSEPATLQTLHELEQWDVRIEVHLCRANGLPLNRNLAAARATSQYLAILDGDDLWAPEKLATQLALMQACPMVGLTYTGYFTFAGEDLSTAVACGVSDLSAARNTARAYFLNDPPIMPSSVLMRRDLFEQVGRFDPTVKVFEDTEFYLRLATACRFAGIDQPLTYKRTRAGSITGQRSALMAHHAYVAFRAASRDCALMALVPRRLSERARKLANVYYYAGDVADASRLYRLAVRLQPWSAAAWAGLLLTMVGGAPARRWLDVFLHRRGAAFGA
jgi:glycosyltransferase involved in cell wall biosynthesis